MVGSFSPRIPWAPKDSDLTGPSTREIKEIFPDP